MRQMNLEVSGNVVRADKTASADSPVQKAPAVKPLLRWAGSKRQLLPNLHGLMPRFDGRYIEPFAGSAALFFFSRPESALLGDLNSDLIRFYQVVKSHAVHVYRIAATLDRSAETYYRLRSDRLEKSDVERAARFYYLNRLCFNGIYRTNSHGHFNVPFAATKVGRFPTEDSFVSACSSLAGADLLNEDFSQTLSRAKAGDFCYIDPPYYSDSSRVFAEYDHRPFCSADVRRLKEYLVELDSKGVLFMVSYQEGPEAASISSGLTVDYVLARRTIASAPTSRKTVRELIIRNYK